MARSRDAWTIDDLHAALAEFEAELRAAQLRESSVSTYVDRTRRFIRWLDDDYSPRGPIDR